MPARGGEDVPRGVREGCLLRRPRRACAALLVSVWAATGGVRPSLALADRTDAGSLRYRVHILVGDQVLFTHTPCSA